MPWYWLFLNLCLLNAYTFVILVFFSKSDSCYHLTILLWWMGYFNDFMTANDKDERLHGNLTAAWMENKICNTLGCIQNSFHFAVNASFALESMMKFWAKSKQTKSKQNYGNILWKSFFFWKGGCCILKKNFHWEQRWEAHWNEKMVAVS